ncbi:hypothetical protein ACFPAF_08650 [Hymenobacter endophyticus]|uniref:Lipoprotein n=1 Tax=Hymenobacter endophyticus TaxID=3076335 RepID=A0ABU3TGE7_9BACT|nr:hypothetical protein [Hymenobacter endophyticus]MDU0370456.1 hypothetical protein [Hymenobacter endophyticus]
MPFLKPLSAPGAWWPRLLLGALLVVLVFGACSTSEFTTENTAVQAPLVLRYRIQKRTQLLFSHYDTLATEMLYHGRPVLPLTLCRPDSSLPTLGRLQRLPQYPARWLLRVQCLAGYEPVNSVYVLRLTTAGPRLHRVGVENSLYSSPPFRLAADTGSVWVPLTDTSGTLFDLQQLRGFAVQFPAFPDSVRDKYDEPTEVYYLAPDRRTLARLFSPDTTTWVITDNGPARRTTAPAPAVYLDEREATTGRLRRQHLPGRMLSAENPFRNTRWQQDSQGRWHLQFIP